MIFLELRTVQIDYIIQKIQSQGYYSHVTEVQKWLEFDLKLHINFSQVKKLLSYKVIPLAKANQLKDENFKTAIPNLKELNLEENVYQAFIDWQRKHGFPNESLALEQIIGEYLEKRVAYPISKLQKPGMTLIESLSNKTLTPDTFKPMPKYLTQVALAKRLGVDDATLLHGREKAKFLQWSQYRDPDNIAWQWDVDLKKYTPILPQ